MWRVMCLVSPPKKVSAKVGALVVGEAVDGFLVGRVVGRIDGLTVGSWDGLDEGRLSYVITCGLASI